MIQPMTKLIASFSAIGLLALACGCGPAPPEIRAGEWRGTTEYGELTFTVDSIGTHFSSRGWQWHTDELKSLYHGRIPVESEGGLINDDGEFEITTVYDGVTLNMSTNEFLNDGRESITIVFSGRFTPSGKSATGVWIIKASKHFSGEWKAEKLE